NFQLSFQAVVEAYHPVITLHKRDEGIPAHDAGGPQHLRPGGDALEPEPAPQLRQAEFHAVFRKAVAANIHFKMGSSRDKSFSGEIVVSRRAFLAVQQLYKSMMPAIQPQGNAGDQGKCISPGRVYYLEIPALEIVAPPAP